MARYLVTGGCGFIGSHLVERLIADDHEVRILDDLSSGRIEHKPEAAELVIGDIANARLVRHLMEGTDGCFHLAAIASVERANRDWCGTHRTNLSGTIAVFDAARAARTGRPVPVVYASSAAVYGAGRTGALAEDDPAVPLSAYGADKLGCELHGRVAAHVHGVPTLGLRFFNVYGPRQDPASPYSGVISIFCDRLARREPITIFGDGGQSRDFIYVGDVVRAVEAAMRRLSSAGPGPVAEILNVCTGVSTSIAGLAATISDLLDIVPEIRQRPPRQGDIRTSLGNPERARDRLGFMPGIPLREGLARTLGSLVETAPPRRRSV